MLPSFSDDPFLLLLQSLAGEHVHFFPKSGNAGDGFIAHATYELFKSYGIKFTAHHQTDTVRSGTVLIGGGGNLVEGRYDDVADLIRRHEAVDRIILLPHTIVGFADVLSRTKQNLTVFCREPVSHRMALMNGASEKNTHLSHDVTFFLDDSFFARYFQAGSGSLSAFRTDGEAAGRIPIPRGNVDISMSWNGDVWTSEEFCGHATNSMAAFIAPFEMVRTDRLHVSILSAFLKKKVYLLPNAYYKNRAVFEHSMRSRFPNAIFVNTSADSTEPDLEGHGTLPDADESARERRWRLELEEARAVIQELKEALERETTQREKHQRALRLQKDRWDLSMRELRSELENSDARCLAGKHREDELLLELARTHAELKKVLASSSWRITRPLRVVAEGIPGGFKEQIRKIIGKSN
ncbi:exopolysaccharide biosynthesis predicted pyruvyl transferase EpsI [Variovorax sp. TBS-050B]|uniref:polysaccharide pyruvyl transferase family protein n=1 Tax=Variovorax sp. TBS-050B TaxID=2940551 RepID=UPI002476BDDA|nr:polysaccharide pyruvyl transferase family protein [Variovorax sp. TBS-050B]MDH6590971.1 exopolysaccharide biosynthesis predicted pyruvyl transferase EpsI [Variovorax sp. TBS-050B]